MMRLLLGGIAMAWFAASSNAFQLTLEEPEGIARDNEPGTVGVPLVRGAVRDPDQVRIHGMPTQNRLLSRWPDGSCQWVLLDFQTSLAARERKVLDVMPGPRRLAPGQGISVNTSSSAHVVSTGTGGIQVAMARQGFDPLKEIRMDRNGDGVFGPDEILKSDGKPCVYTFDYETTEPDGPAVQDGYHTYIWMRKSRGGPSVPHRVDPASVEVTVQEQGPLRTVVKVAGRLKTLEGLQEGQFVLRFHFYANQPYVRLQHAFVFSYDNRRNYLRRLVLRIPLDLGSDLTYLAKPGGNERSGPLSNAASLYAEGEPDPFDHPEGSNAPRYRLTVDGKTMEAGVLPRGWLGMGGSRGRAAVGMRDFMEMYPCNLAATAGENPSVSLGFWPEEGGWAVHHGEYAHEPRGTAIEHECVLMFGGPATPVSHLDRTWAGFQDPLYPASDPEYVFDQTGTLGPIAPFPTTNDTVESFLACCMSVWSRAQERMHLSGAFNWGDNAKMFKRNSRGQWRVSIRRDMQFDVYDGFAHHNNGVDFRAMLQYMRTGFYPYRRYCERQWKHSRSVNTTHWLPPGADGLALGTRHSAYQWGVVDRPGGHGDLAHGNSIHKQYGMDPLTAWLHWNLTGDWRTLEVLDTYAIPYQAATGVPVDNCDDCPHGVCGGVMLSLMALIPGKEGYAAHGKTLLDKAIGTGTFPWRAHFDALRAAYRPMLYVHYYFVTGDTRAKDAFLDWIDCNFEKAFRDDGRFWSHIHGRASEAGIGYYYTKDPKYLPVIERILKSPYYNPASTTGKARSSRYRQIGLAGIYELPEGELFAYLKDNNELHENQQWQSSGAYLLYLTHMFGK